MQPPEDIESQSFDRARFVNIQARARRVSATTTLCLLLCALIVVGIGIVCGTFLYRQYLQAQMHRFRGWCNIPYDDAQQAMFVSSNKDSKGLSDSDLFRPYNNDDEFEKAINNYFFQEQFELDLEDEKYEKIDVPDFRDGRSGRFIHDFNTNTTGIVDASGKRCFVMPLNRDNVLPPKSLYDLIHKIWDGYYKVNTEVVRETMKVVTPPIEDTKEIGAYIANECQGLPIYKLEKYVGGGKIKSFIYLFSLLPEKFCYKNILALSKASSVFLYDSF